MNPDKFLEMQHQMRQNQAEVQDLLKDIDSWAEEMHNKKPEPKVEDDQELPPVRNSLDVKRKKKRKKPKREPLVEEHLIPSRRIKSSDYRSWDKFDVDKAMDDLDKAETKNESESSGSETDEEWEIERKKKKAELLKDQGNQLFKEGKYDEAIECYTSGIACDPDNALLPANRAMALIKCEKFGCAEKDCSVAIVLDPTYVKAYSRRATSRMGLKKYEEAKADFQKVLSLEPQNRQAKAELGRIEMILNPPPTSVEVCDTGIVKPIYIPPSRRSKKPLRRLIVEEIGVGEDEARSAAVASAVSSQSQAKQQITVRDEQQFEQFTTMAKPSGDSAEHNNINSDSEENHTLKYGKKVTIEEVANGDSVTAVASSENQKHPKVHPEGKRTSKSGTAKTDEVTPQAAKPKREMTSPSSSPRVPPVPTTSFQFQTDWKTLRHHPEKFYQYLKEINPSSYVKLFGEALESDMLMSVMKSLQEYYIHFDLDAFPVLKCMTDVKRFAMTAMFMSSSDKQVIENLFKHVRTKGTYTKDEIDMIAKKYGLKSS